MSEKVRMVVRQDEPGEKRMIFFCPGCKAPHQFRIAGKKGPIWDFNHNMESPTFAPSLKTEREGAVCHLFLKSGMIEYCHDCSHALAGQTVECPNIESWL